jgi:hypothetical protein
MPMEYQTEIVTFHVGPETSHLPVGDFPGVIEWAFVPLGSHTKNSMMTCRLRIERNDPPGFFSPNNSMQSADVPVLQEVKGGTITFSRL